MNKSEIDNLLKMFLSENRDDKVLFYSIFLDLSDTETEMLYTQRIKINPRVETFFPTSQLWRNKLLSISEYHERAR